MTRRTFAVLTLATCCLAIFPSPTVSHTDIPAEMRAKIEEARACKILGVAVETRRIQSKKENEQTSANKDDTKAKEGGKKEEAVKTIQRSADSLAELVKRRGRLPRPDAVRQVHLNFTGEK